MAFTFTPKTEEQLKAENKFTPWPAGEYDFEIFGAEEKISRNGNPMIELDIMIFNQDGKSRKIKDWLMESMAFKLKHACEATGIDYDAGSFEGSDFSGRTGKLKLGIQKGTEQYPDERNNVVDYVVNVKPSGSMDDLNDSVPF